jgi:hypothetical protein
MRPGKSNSAEPSDYACPLIVWGLVLKIRRGDILEECLKISLICTHFPLLADIRSQLFNAAARRFKIERHVLKLYYFL